MNPALRDLKVAGALLTVWCLWGSSFLGIRVVVLSAPPLLSAGVRFVAAGLLLLAGIACWRRWRGGPSIREDLAGRVRWLALLGSMHFLVANGLVSVATRDLPSSSAAVLYSTVPLWLLLMAAAVARSRPSVADLGVTGLGVLGVAIVLGVRSASILPSVLVLLAAGAWAGATLLAAHGSGNSANGRRQAGPALDSSVQMLAGGLGLLFAAWVTGEWGSFDPAAVTTQAWVAEGYLILFGSLAGFFAYTWLVSSKVDPRLTGTFAYVNPIVAVALGALVLDEHLGPNTLLGTALVAASVALTVLARVPRSRPASGPGGPPPRVSAPVSGER